MLEYDEYAGEIVADDYRILPITLIVMMLGMNHVYEKPNAKTTMC